MKLALINAKNNRAQADEGIILAYAPRPGAPWVSTKHLAHTPGWKFEDTVLVNFTHASGIISNGRSGGILSIRGSAPLVLAICHPWSGIIDLRTGPWASTLDLHNDRTTVVLIDVTNGLTIEVDPSKYFNDGAPFGIATDPVALVSPALRSGHFVKPLVFITRLLRSLSGRRLIPSRFATLFVKAPSQRVTSAILDGVLGNPLRADSRSSGSGTAHMSDQFILLTAAVEGLSRRIRNS